MRPRLYERPRFQRFDTVDESLETVQVDPMLYREYEQVKREQRRRRTA